MVAGSRSWSGFSPSRNEECNSLLIEPMTSPHHLWPEYEQPIRGPSGIQVRLREKSSKPCSKSWKPTLLNRGLYDEYGGFSNSFNLTLTNQISSKCLTRRIAKTKIQSQVKCFFMPPFQSMNLGEFPKSEYRPSHWFHDHISQARFVASPSTRIESLDYLQPFYQSFHHLPYLKTKNVKTPSMKQVMLCMMIKGVSSITRALNQERDVHPSQDSLVVHNEKSLVLVTRESDSFEESKMLRLRPQRCSCKSPIHSLRKPP